MGAGDIVLLHTDDLVEHCDADGNTTTLVVSNRRSGMSNTRRPKRSWRPSGQA